MGVDSSGTFFTDFAYLYDNELTYLVYRMSNIQLCGNPSGQLTGMRSTITKYSTSSMAPMSTVSLNRIGSVNDTNISCSTMYLNAVAGEYVQQINYSWDTKQMQYIQIISSAGNVISLGNYNTYLTTNSVNYSAD